MIGKCIILTLVVLFPALSFAQLPALPDSTKDTVTVNDTLKTGVQKPVPLAEPEQRISDLQKRMQKFKESSKLPPRFVFYDSLVTYLASARFNRRSQIDRSFFHDAGDYFKFDPDFFVVDYQATPMRKTAQPFGLSGDRLNVISNGIVNTPFEHTVEPDGLMDLNDIPTALDGAVYIIPGPVGELFGGQNGTATLLTVSALADSNKPASGLMADKGYFGYAFVRGRYAREFSNGRKIELSASSRGSDGVAFGRDDDQQHYTTTMYFPIGANFGFNIDGQMYDRDATLTIRPDIGGAYLNRHRFDRSLRASIEFQNGARSSRSELGYRHLRQGSYIDGIYKGRFNNTVNGAFAIQERKLGSRIFKTEATVDFPEYDNGYKQYARFNSSIGFSLAPLKHVNALDLQAKVAYSSDFDLLPSGTVVYQSDYQKLFVQLAVSYTVKEPTLHQINLPLQQKALYGSLPQQYSEQGNANLKKESQLIASITIEPGRVDNNFSINATGGKILHAIQWRGENINQTISYLNFSPVNDDMTFFTVSAKPSFRIADFLRFNSGAAYHYYDYKSLGKQPYQPEYNLFSGMELHYYWADRLVDLYAYGELVYTGPYDGYNKQNLGKELVANAKLSLGLKNFRFHLVFQNSFNNSYEAREDLLQPGRFFYYGIDWKFFD